LIGILRSLRSIVAFAARVIVLKARNTLAKTPFGASIRLKCWRVKLDTEYLASN
jgi:hypothetical protein